MIGTLLLHVCCAHCTAYPIRYWQQQGYEVTAYWYNPNIHPFTEYQNRLEATKSLSQEMKFNLIIEPDYDIVAYFRAVTGNETDRCRYCFRLRLAKAAAAAKQGGFDGFTTTLAISPHQDQELIKAAGSHSSAKYGVEFLYTDLRKRYSDSRHITKPMNLYRQQYCGCVYSEWERYRT